MRHGRSSWAHDGSWVDVPAFERFVEAYDDAGIAADSLPPPELVELTANATDLVASDLRRAIESAQRVGNGRRFETTPLLREAPVAMTRVGLPLPLDVWDTIANILWLTRRYLGTDAKGTFARAREAADWLADRSMRHASIVVITHGTFRFMLGRELARRGLRQSAGGADVRNWSVWSFVDRA